MVGRVAGRRRDLISGVPAWLIWGVPTGLILLTRPDWTDPAVRIGVWTGSFLVMGVACLVNARRCNRVHCWFTGPFFLLLAVLSLGHGVGALPMGPDGWTRIVQLFGIGIPLLYFVPERIWGRNFGAG